MCESGHEFVIYGYESRLEIKDKTMNLIIMNPKFTWTISDKQSQFDIVTIAPGKKSSNLPISGLFLDVRGFQGQEKKLYLNHCDEY
ncbi:MAG: hypothetical protein H7235_08670 [Bdellovibrionaceae bacterium]|nr:hypothetical protein [Pseudobdellovibrionaceae bacterium]